MLNLTSGKFEVRAEVHLQPCADMRAAANLICSSHQSTSYTQIQIFV